jgi:hypothetical protein
LYNERAMFRLIFWVFVLFLALSYLGISIQAIISSPAGQANAAYIIGLLSQAWQWLSVNIQPIINFVRMTVQNANSHLGV